MERHDLEGQTFLVTGANSGIGASTARALAARGGHVFLACRSADKGRAFALELARTAASSPARVELLHLDLADFASIRRAAAVFCERGLALTGLINNAGLSGIRGLTRDGFELTWGVNHLGHFLLTLLLQQRLSEGRGRVVNVSSDLHRKARGVDFNALRSPARAFGMHEYRVSKLCNVLFSQELARRWAPHGIGSVALHPGSVATGMQRTIPAPARRLLQLFLVPAEVGAKTSLFCATDAGVVSGRYYEKQRETAPSALAQDEPLAKRLWQFSESAID